MLGSQRNGYTRTNEYTSILFIAFRLKLFFKVVPPFLQCRDQRGSTCRIDHRRSDHTSRRSSCLAFSMEAPCRVLKCATPLLHGEGGLLLSYRDARGNSRSSRSSSLVYPLLCTIDPLRSSSGLPQAVSATFSATSSSVGGLYTTGAAVTGNVLIMSFSVNRSSKLCKALVAIPVEQFHMYVGNTRFFQIEGKTSHFSKRKVYLRIQLL